MRWSAAGWEGGAEAKVPAPISSFAGLDAILAALFDRQGCTPPVP